MRSRPESLWCNRRALTDPPRKRPGACAEYRKVQRFLSPQFSELKAGAHASKPNQAAFTFESSKLTFSVVLCLEEAVFVPACWFARGSKVKRFSSNLSCFTLPSCACSQSFAKDNSPCALDSRLRHASLRAFCLLQSSVDAECW